MSRRSALTLLELMIALVGTVLLSAALAASYSAALTWQRSSATYAATLENQSPLEDQLREALESAFLTADAADTASFFVASNSSGIAETSDSLSFTRVCAPPNRRFLSSDADFEERNETYGPQGGLEELSLSPAPVGEEAVGEGVFIRRQRPADGEPTQGGSESLFSGDIQELSFEFYDGSEWVTSWDTTNGTARRLPAAVRVTYRRTDDEQSRSLTVRLKHSDVTPENPVVVGEDQA